MIMGALCTRRCPFCDVAHGRPLPLDPNEPIALTRTVCEMGLSYVVITSVDRDDLRDGGAGHFAACVSALRADLPEIQIEILVPDFRGRAEVALDILSQSPPNVFNHNLETVPRLYRRVRPGADYEHSLTLLRQFGERCSGIPTKSGLMLGLGETIKEVEAVMNDLRDHGVQILTLGQYLQPSLHHLPVERYVDPEEFNNLRIAGKKIGFAHIASGPMVRSSYHADQHARAARVGFQPVLGNLAP
jgi:lipoic acid synthetase